MRAENPNPPFTYAICGISRRLAVAEAGYLRYYEKKRTPPNVFGRVRFFSYSVADA